MTKTDCQYEIDRKPKLEKPLTNVSGFFLARSQGGKGLLCASPPWVGFPGRQLQPPGSLFLPYDIN